MDRRTVLARGLALATAAALAPGVARAGAPRVFSPGGVAIRGVDPVSYFTHGQPVAGDDRFALMWRGATWLFAMAESRTAFEADPHRLAPVFGGYCAYALSLGELATTDPEAWTIHEGRLYLCHTPGYRDRWRQDIPGNIARAKTHWPAVLR